MLVITLDPSDFGQITYSSLCNVLQFVSFVMQKGFLFKSMSHLHHALETFLFIYLSIGICNFVLIKSS